MQDITSDHSCPSIIYRILTKKIFATLYHEKFVKKKVYFLSTWYMLQYFSMPRFEDLTKIVKIKNLI